ncbi:hypothetical protein RHDC1_00156 [Rhodocyclaceae bacterium]|jgi:hypothetical protein|nr:hypothetical protein RHDC1_00156 [Rhodocyclaceae bacterium]
MSTSRLLLILIGVALAAFAAGWAFKGYLAPGAVIDFANQRFFCN